MDADHTLHAVFAPNGSQIGQELFSITSNSTISEITFLSGYKILDFVVSGPSGTTDYTEILVAKIYCELLRVLVMREAT